MKKIGLSLLLATGMFSGNAFAAESIDATPFLKLGYAFGGDDRGELNYEGGGSSEVTSGGGYTIGGGLRFPINSLDLSKNVGLNLSAAYHADSATASNADITFDRFEFAVMPYVELNEKVTFSAGVEFHTGVEWTLEDDYTDITLEYDSATALAAELIFNTGTPAFKWSIKAALVDYSGSDFDEEISGSNVGAFLFWSM